MSGLRKCAECDRLFRIENDGPEYAPGGIAPKHTCGKCRHVKTIIGTLKEMAPKGRTEFSARNGQGPVGRLIVPRAGQEAAVFTIRYQNDKMIAGLIEEHSGRDIHPEILFDPDHVEALEPIIKVLP